MLNKALLILCAALAVPVVAKAADISVDLNVGGVAVHIGDRDPRGYYWDGYDWRAPQWWHEHHGHRMGERNERGMYWWGDRWQNSAPPEHHQPEHGVPHGQPNGGQPHGEQSQFHGGQQSHVGQGQQQAQPQGGQQQHAGPQGQQQAQPHGGQPQQQHGGQPQQHGGQGQPIYPQNNTH
jgi:hypothetical protein